MFKEGMEVLIYSYDSPPQLTVGTVASVTPSGRIVTLSDGRRFAASGRLWGHSGYSAETIEPLTARARARLAEQRTAKERAAPTQPRAGE